MQAENWCSFSLIFAIYSSRWCVASILLNTWSLNPICSFLSSIMELLILSILSLASGLIPLMLVCYLLSRDLNYYLIKKIWLFIYFLSSEIAFSIFASSILTICWILPLIFCYSSKNFSLKHSRKLFMSSIVRDFFCSYISIWKCSFKSY